MFIYGGGGRGHGEKSPIFRYCGFGGKAVPLHPQRTSIFDNFTIINSKLSNLNSKLNKNVLVMKKRLNCFMLAAMASCFWSLLSASDSAMFLLNAFFLP